MSKFGYKLINRNDANLLDGTNFINGLNFNSPDTIYDITTLVMSRRIFPNETFRYILAKLFFRRYNMQTFDYYEHVIPLLINDLKGWGRLLNELFIGIKYDHFDDFLHNVYKLYLIHLLPRRSDSEEMRTMKLNYLNEHFFVLRNLIMISSLQNTYMLYYYIDFLLELNQQRHYFGIDIRNFKDFNKFCINETLYFVLFERIRDKKDYLVLYQPEIPGETDEQKRKRSNAVYKIIGVYFDRVFKDMYILSRLLLPALLYHNYPYFDILVDLTRVYLEDTIIIEDADRYLIRAEGPRFSFRDFYETSKQTVDKLGEFFEEGLIKVVLKLYETQKDMGIITQERHFELLQEINKYFDWLY